jgi:DNA-binding response OmpR family regulator
LIRKRKEGCGTDILLAEENADLLCATTSWLKDEGFIVTAEDKGLKALVAIRSRTFDCIVLDVRLPDIDGFGVLKAARVFTDTPIILLVDMGSTEEIAKCREIRCDDYMTTPYSLPELTDRIRTLVCRKKVSSLNNLQ